jgi:uncharacterized protein YjbJ (UPF0337 family)
MNTDILEGKWKQISGSIKQQWGDLTDDEVAQVNGSYERLQGLLQEKYGWNRDRAEREIDAYLNQYRGY